MSWTMGTVATAVVLVGNASLMEASGADGSTEPSLSAKSVEYGLAANYPDNRVVARRYVGPVSRW